MIKATINPAIMRWARKSAGFDTAEVAKAVGKTKECIESWESGIDQPTIPQMRKVANKLKRPLAVFYLSEVPEDFDALRDLRRLPDGQSIAYSPKLRFVLRHIQSQQKWAAEYLRAHDSSKVKFIGKASLTSDIQQLAQWTRSLLKVSLNEQASWSNYQTALRKWIGRCEEVGVFVFQSSEVQPNEMRGCAFPDQYAPAILLNSKDAYSARIFTLFHEFSHLLLNISGVSNLDLAEHVHTSEQKIEFFCNRLAAEILVPIEDLKRFWEKDVLTTNVDEKIYSFAKRFFVSREVIARRLLDSNFVSNDFYEIKRAKYQSEYLELKKREAAKKKEKESWVPRYRIVTSKNGRAFTRIVLNAYADGDIYGRDVSGLLDTKLKHLDAITHDVFSGFQENSL